MKYLPAIIVALLLISPSICGAQQLSPNPNPLGNTITADSASLYNEVAFENYGTIDATSNSTLINYSDVNNFGTLTNAGKVYNYGGRFYNSGTVDNDGTLFNYGDWDNHGTLANDGSFENYYILSNIGTFINEGNLDNRDGTFINYGTFANNSTLNNTGGSLTNSGFISGNGTFVGTVTDNGTLSPGNSTDVQSGGVFSTAVLTFTGLNKAGGSTEVQLGGLLDGGDNKANTTFDWLEVSGDVSLAGTLNVSLLGDFALSDRDYFNVIRVDGTLSGQFDGLGEGGLVGTYGGEELFVTYGGGDGNDVVLYVNSIPEPNSTAFLILLAGLGITVRRRR